MHGCVAIVLVSVIVIVIVIVTVIVIVIVIVIVVAIIIIITSIIIVDRLRLEVAFLRDCNVIVSVLYSHHQYRNTAPSVLRLEVAFLS